MIQELIAQEVFLNSSTSLFNGDFRVALEERVQVTHVSLHAISHVQPNPYVQHFFVSHVLTFNLLLLKHMQSNRLHLFLDLLCTYCCAYVFALHTS